MRESKRDRAYGMAEAWGVRLSQGISLDRHCVVGNMNESGLDRVSPHPIGAPPGSLILDISGPGNQNEATPGRAARWIMSSRSPQLFECWIWLLISTIWLLGGMVSSAMVDLNGDGMSDIWEWTYSMPRFRS